jgi:hypothetical protein
MVAASMAEAHFASIFRKKPDGRKCPLIARMTNLRYKTPKSGDDQRDKAGLSSPDWVVIDEVAYINGLRSSTDRTEVSIFHVHRSPLSLIMRKLHNIGLAKMQTESRTFGRTIFDDKWPRFTENAERPEKSHRFGKPSFAALTVQLCGDQPNKPIPAKRLR